MVCRSSQQKYVKSGAFSHLLISGNTSPTKLIFEKKKRTSEDKLKYFFLIFVRGVCHNYF